MSSGVSDNNKTCVSNNNIIKILKILLTQLVTLCYRNDVGNLRNFEKLRREFDYDNENTRDGSSSLQ